MLTNLTDLFLLGRKLETFSIDYLDGLCVDFRDVSEKLNTWPWRNVTSKRGIYSSEFKQESIAMANATCCCENTGWHITWHKR